MLMTLSFGIAATSRKERQLLDILRVSKLERGFDAQMLRVSRSL